VSARTIKVHLDTDIGGDIDDLCALAMLLAWPGVDLTGVTTVADEGGRRAGYARYALRLAGRPGVPVAAGAGVAQGYFRWVPEYPPEGEYWPEPVPPWPNPSDEAVELLADSIRAGALIVGIGPCTNLALLDRKYPGLLQDANVYLMGGFISAARGSPSSMRPAEGLRTAAGPAEGSRSSDAPAPLELPVLSTELDYNLQMDAASARRIIERCRPTLIPISVSVQTALRASYLPGLRRAGPLGELLARQAAAFAVHERYTERYARTRSGLPAGIINFQHDPLACAVALGWDGVRIEQLPLLVEIEDGWLVERVDEAGVGTPVVTAVDGPRFDELWYNLLSR
jgi:inosine-uridine nucleoside N-ribohydrolase